MGRRGPAPRIPTDDERRVVENCVAIGYTQEQIALILGVSETWIKKNFREELRAGKLKADAQVAGKLFEKAMKGDTASIIFWCKTRMGWRETSNINHESENGSMSPPSLSDFYGGLAQRKP